MTTQFRILFTVTITHAYYSGGCKDFDFLIPADTAQVLKNGRLVARVRDGKLVVLFETKETGAALAAVAGKKLRIGLKLLNPYFSNFTALAFDTRASIPLYRNAVNPDVLDAPKVVPLVGRLFGHVLTGTARPVTAMLKDSAGQALQAEAITTANNRTTVSCNLTGQAAGAYVVEEAYPSDTELIPYYCDPELRQLGPFGVMEIEVGSSFYVAAPTFELVFAARQETLNYYLVARNYNVAEFGQLAVVDTGFTEDGRPQVVFTRVESSAFTADEIDPSLLGGGDARVALFRSQATVARRERARKKIQLKRNGEVLITHLPQVGADKVSGDIIVQISKP
jgi:hypothetical protein